MYSICVTQSRGILNKGRYHLLLQVMVEISIVVFPLLLCDLNTCCLEQCCGVSVSFMPGMWLQTAFFPMKDPKKDTDTRDVCLSKQESLRTVFEKLWLDVSYHAMLHCV